MRVVQALIQGDRRKTHQTERIYFYYWRNDSPKLKHLTFHKSFPYSYTEKESRTDYKNQSQVLASKLSPKKCGLSESSTAVFVGSRGGCTRRVDFEVENRGYNRIIDTGLNDVLVKNLYLSIDPYRLNKMKKYRFFA
ncbi:hypothetical protein Syun_025597 [Stephania yunnanensis]|uniref:Uncharacterized protein n=1 Tax=Stephania yunnanensis TaxID=152371 RepID=A0AAP0EXA8_9MAGN